MSTAAREGTRRDSSLLFQIKFAFDVLTTPVLLVDNDSFVVYHNKAMLELFKRHGKLIKKHVPDFKTSSPLGCSICDFFKESTVDEPLSIFEISEKTQCELHILGASFHLNISPVEDNLARQVGLLIEWEEKQEFINAIDVHESHKASNEEKLKTREACAHNADKLYNDLLRAEKALDSLQVPFLLTDSDSRVVFASDELKQYLSSMFDFSKNYYLEDLFKIPAIRANKPHKNKEDLLEQLVNIGDHEFRVMTHPLYDEEKRMGTLLNWVPRSHQNKHPQINDEPPDTPKVRESTIIQKEVVDGLREAMHQLNAFVESYDKNKPLRQRELDDCVAALSDMLMDNQSKLFQIQEVAHLLIDDGDCGRDNWADARQFLHGILTRFKKDGASLNLLREKLSQINMLAINLNVNALKVDGGSSILLLANELKDKSDQGMLAIDTLIAHFYELTSLIGDEQAAFDKTIQFLSSFIHRGKELESLLRHLSHDYGKEVHSLNTIYQLLHKN